MIVAPHALGRERLVEELLRRNAELTLLNDVAVASAQLDPELLLEGAVRRIAEVLRCAVGAAFLREGDRLASVVVFGVRPEAAAAARIVPIGRGPCGEAVQRREVTAYPNPEAAGGTFAANMRGEGLRAVAGVPLLTKEEPVGGFVLARRTDEPFTDEELGFLKALGAQLGVAVENSRLYAAARRQVDHLDSIRALAHRVFADPQGGGDALLADGCREIARALDASYAAVFLVSPDRRTLQGRAVHGFDVDASRLVLPVASDALSADAVLKGVASQTPDATLDPRSAMHGSPRVPPMSLLAVPLGPRDAPRGVVFVGSRPGRAFDEREVALAQALTAAMAVGLENAGLAVDLDRSHAELEAAQAQLLHRERLAALGALAAAVAHEIRNPLGVVFNALGMLRRHRAMDEEGRGLVDIVGEEAERLNRIVSDLLGFARPASPSLREVPLSATVEEAVRAALAGRAQPIDLALELPEEVGRVAVDAALVRQAVINVVQNAAQAMGRGGRLRVRTARSDAHAVIEVTDSGPGIPAELRERIFQPFFTTRTSGTGLGLAIVRRVVELHGGDVEAGAGPDGGARFTLRFPLAPVGTR